MSTREDREWDERQEYGYSNPLDPFARASAILSDRFTEIPIELDEPDEIDEDDAVDIEDRPSGYLEVDEREPVPEFASFDAWCPDSEEWVALWRPGPEGPWFCRNCGGTDHQFRDHEGGGA